MTQTPPLSTSRTLYPGKGKRVQGILSKDGGLLFERVRTALSHATSRRSISDADVIDFAVRCCGNVDAIDGTVGELLKLVVRDMATEPKVFAASKKLVKSERA